MTEKKTKTPKTATVLARIDPELKKQADAVLDRLGIPASLLINMLYNQIVLTKGIPFKISVPDNAGEYDMETNSFTESNA